MASRRTRIKGIANIPQRRKTVNTNAEDAIPELEKNEKDEHNLNVAHETAREFEQIGESAVSPEQPKQDVTVQESVVDNKENNIDSHVKEIGTTAAEDQQTPLTEKPQAKSIMRRKFVKPTVSSNAFNRKAKEADSILNPKNTGTKQKNDIIILSDNILTPSQPLIQNGVNIHQDKQIESTANSLLKSSEAQINVATPISLQDQAKVVDASNTQTRNNKIVILDTAISHPNQNQELNIVTSEEPNNLLKPPEITIPAINTHDGTTKRFVPHSPQIVTPDLEYPIPPPSPNKMNRSRIKAVPRLGQRNTSFSASESEDESRRNYRHRNDSVCSSTSGLQDTNSLPECFSPQKPKEFNSVIQRKCRRTEQSRKLAEARRDFYLKFGNKTPDRQKLTMIDLIFYNPVTNLMSDNKSRRKNSESENRVEEQESVDDPVVEEEAAKSGSDEENEIPAPQIKLGPQGELVLDEQSLVVENKSVKKSRDEIEKSTVVNADFDTGYGVYKRAKRSKDWNKHETLKFYKALNTIGTDFTLMCELFPRRSRRELKMKFKKEERVNKTLVDRAIMQPCNFDFNDFKHEVDMEEKELQEVEKLKEKERQVKVDAKKRKSSVASPRSEPPEKMPKVEKKKKRPLDIMDVLEDESDADESEIESVDGTSEDKLMQTIQKPTRSGRVPKVLNRYKAPEADAKSNKAKPGSLIVVAGTGDNGQPVYKVCMVTDENGRRQIGEDMTSLEKALQCKENGVQSLFTLSASNNNETEENLMIHEENESLIRDE